MKTVLGWAVAVFAIYYLVTAPEGAAHVVNGGLDWLKSAAASLGTFLNNVKL